MMILRVRVKIQLMRTPTKRKFSKKIKKILKIQKKKKSPSASKPDSMNEQMKLLLQMMNKKASPTPSPALANNPMALLQQLLGSSQKRENGRINQLENNLKNMLHPGSAPNTTTRVTPVEPRLKASDASSGGSGSLTWPTVQAFVEAKEKQTSARLDSLTRHFEEVINSTHHASERDNRQMQERMSVVTSVMTELKTVASALQQLKWDMNQPGGPPSGLPEFSEYRQRSRRNDDDEYDQDGNDDEDEGNSGQGFGGKGGFDDDEDGYQGLENDMNDYPNFRQLRSRRKPFHGPRRRQGPEADRSIRNREGTVNNSIDKLLSTINAFPTQGAPNSQAF